MRENATLQERTELAEDLSVDLIEWTKAERKAWLDEKIAGHEAPIGRTHAEIREQQSNVLRRFLGSLEALRECGRIGRSRAELLQRIAAQRYRVAMDASYHEADALRNCEDARSVGLRAAMQLEAFRHQQAS